MEGVGTEGRDRPSRHGMVLGRELAALAVEGRRGAKDLPDMCATCAFREGCMTNMMAATGVMALNCTLGVDSDDFACHHGMVDGQPQKLCAGYLAAKRAPFPMMKDALLRIAAELDAATGPDTVRERFDAWVATVDPDGKLDDYERGRRFLRANTSTLEREGGGPPATQTKGTTNGQPS